MKSRRLYLILGILLLIFIIGSAIGADSFTQVSPYYADNRITALEPAVPFPPSLKHPLGTDSLGRDIWSRIAYGARWSLLFASVVAIGRIILALPLAWLAVVGPRPFKWLVEKLYVLTNTVPPLLLYLILLAVPAVRTIGLIPSITLTLTVLTLWEWPRMAGTIKGRMEQLMQEGYVEGAIATGAGNGRLFRIHLLPHLMPLLLRVGIGEMGQVLLTIAHLGLFGVWVGGGSIEIITNSRGADVPIITTSIPEWGTILSEARTWLRTAPWIPLAPAGAFFLAITGFQLLSQGLESIPVRVRHLRWWGLGLAGALSLVMGFVWLQASEVIEAIPAMTAQAAQAAGTADLTEEERLARKIPPQTSYMDMKGFETDIKAFYVPWDATPEAFQRRFYVNRVAFAADKAALRVRGIVGAEALGRPVLRLYPTDEAFNAATGNAVGYLAVTGDEIAISPRFAVGLVTKELIRALVYTEVQAISHRAGRMDPVVMGRLERDLSELTPYRPNWEAIVGKRLPSLTELYGGQLKAGDLPYMTATAILVEFLEAEGRQNLTAEEAPQLAAKFDAFLYAKLAEQSMLTVPAVRKEFPPTLLAAFEADAQGRERLLMHAVENGPERKVTVLTKDASGVSLSFERWAETDGTWHRIP